MQESAVAEAAWRLLLEKCYGGTTMGDVAATARVSLRTVYRLYPGKPELFTAVVELHRRTMLALPGDYDDYPVEEALAQIFQIDIDAEAEQAQAALMTLFIVEGRQFPELAPLVREYGADRSRALVGEWLERQVAQGRLNVPDPQTAAKMLMDVTFGAISLKSEPGPQWPGGGDRRDYLRRCFSLIAAGMVPR